MKVQSIVIVIRCWNLSHLGSNADSVTCILKGHEFRQNEILIQGLMLIRIILYGQSTDPP